MQKYGNLIKTNSKTLVQTTDGDAGKSEVNEINNPITREARDTNTLLKIIDLGVLLIKDAVAAGIIVVAVNKRAPTIGIKMANEKELIR